MKKSASFPRKNLKKWTVVLAMTAVLASGCSTQHNSTESKATTEQSKPVVTPAAQQKAPGAVNNAFTEYLQTNKASLNLQTDVPSEGLFLLDGDLQNHRLFLTGEVHQVAHNIDLQIQLLRYLHEKAGVNYYLGEMSFSESQFINLYLKTGDENYLPRTSKDDQRLWKWVYGYNQSQPKDKQISFVGMDVDHDPMGGLLYLHILIEPLQTSGKPVPAELKPFLEEMKDYTIPRNQADNGKLRSRIGRTMELLHSEMRDYRNLWSAALDKETFFQFQLVAENVIHGEMLHSLYFKSDWPRFNNERDPIMFANFKKIAARLPEAKFFGEWGMEHVYQKEHATSAYREVKPRIAELINAYGDFKGRVLSIGMMYAGSQTWDMGSNTTNDADSGLQDMALIGPLADSDLMLYKLNGANSPFADTLKFVKGGTGGATTDYMQYVALIRRSPAFGPVADSAQ